MTALKIIGFILILAGAFINYGAKFITRQLNLAAKINVDEASEFADDDLEEYKMTKAIARVKVAGFLVLLPGVLLLFYLYR